MRLKRRFEMAPELPDYSNEPMQVYRFHEAPQPRNGTMLILATVCAMVGMCFLGSVGATLIIMKRPPVIRHAISEDIQPVRIPRHTWQPPQDWNLNR